MFLASLTGGRQAVVAPGVGGIVLGHTAAYGLLDDLYAVIRVVDHPVTARPKPFELFTVLYSSLHILKAKLLELISLFGR